MRNLDGTVSLWMLTARLLLASSTLLQMAEVEENAFCGT